MNLELFMNLCEGYTLMVVEIPIYIITPDIVRKLYVDSSNFSVFFWVGGLVMKNDILYHTFPKWQ